MIFYFTGTGNCLHAARAIADVDEKILSIPRVMRGACDEMMFADEAIGIVYPIYGHMMPRMVRQFIERARLETPYFYVVATYGNRHANAVELAQEECRAAGLDVAYATTLQMVDNWLPAFDMNEQCASAGEKRIDENLKRIRSDVMARRRWIEPVSDVDRAAHEEFLTRGIRFEPGDLVDFLRIDAQACTNCGICAQVCPAGCITQQNGSAVRDALAGMGCNGCLACIHACSQGAIALPSGEKNPHARWRNEHVSLRDLMVANSR